MKKEKDEEKGELLDNTESNLTEDDLREISRDLDIHVRKFENDDSSDGYYKAIVKELMNPKNISMKTEYLSVNENFSGTKLEYLSKFGNMPYLHSLVNIFEIKRTSLLRKSRKELVMSLERREEMRAEVQANTIKSMFGY